MLARGAQFLPREDQDAAEILKKQLEEDGCELQFGAKPTNFELIEAASDTENPKIKVSVLRDGEVAEMIVEGVLVAVGRVPNVENLGLEQAGIAYSTDDGI